MRCANFFDAIWEKRSHEVLLEGIHHRDKHGNIDIITFHYILISYHKRFLTFYLGTNFLSFFLANAHTNYGAVRACDLVDRKTRRVFGKVNLE